MGLLGWIFYMIMGIIVYIITLVLDNKYNITKIQKLIISIIIMMFMSGFCFKYAIKYTDNIFLIFVFEMIADVIYTSYFADRDFFDKNENNILFYILLVIVGFVVNQDFINKVSQVFLTGEDLRIILWFLVLIFVYSFMKEKNIMTSKSNDKNRYISVDTVLVNYARLKHKFYDNCDYDNKDLSNIIYSIMIYEDNRRSKVLRNYDYFMFKLNGNKRKLGIMQVESDKFITDSDSIDLVYKKLEKLYKKNTVSTKTKKTVDLYKVIEEFCGDSSDYVKYIFDIIKKF